MPDEVSASPTFRTVTSKRCHTRRIYGVGARNPRLPSGRVRPMTRRIRVLIAEDHDDSRDGYATYLQREGMDVRAVPDGLQALKVARRWKPDVAVLDLSMPKVTGDEVARL